MMTMIDATETNLPFQDIYGSLLAPNESVQHQSTLRLDLFGLYSNYSSQSQRYKGLRSDHSYGYRCREDCTESEDDPRNVGFGLRSRYRNLVARTAASSRLCSSCHHCNRSQQRICMTHSATDLD